MPCMGPRACKQGGLLMGLSCQKNAKNGALCVSPPFVVYGAELVVNGNEDSLISKGSVLCE